MEKSQGATLGTVILAALLLRPGTANTPEPKPPAPSGSIAAANKLYGIAVSGDGPWVASCEFWAPERTIPNSKVAMSKISAESSAPDQSFSVEATLLKDESDCIDQDDGSGGLGKWGVPAAGSSPRGKVKIDAIIATVPDPIRTNLALQFDWGVDAMLAAAADNGYVSTYYWLPWDNKAVAEGNARAKPQSAEQEREPGLIILKPVNDPVPAEDLRSAVYVFLVAETPTSGINAYQMERAFDYEDLLASSSADFHRFLTGRGSGMDVIGPVFSASAAGLRRALEFWLNRHNIQNLEGRKFAINVNGTTATTIAYEQMNGISWLPPSTEFPCGKTIEPDEKRIQYQSFEGYANDAHDRITNLLRSSNARSSRIAFLIEDGTTLGQNEATHGQDRKCTTDAPSSESPGVAHKALVIRFPREISLLRNAETTEPSSTVAPPSPYLKLSLKDTNSYDGVPHFSREDTPLIQEAELMAIVRQLDKYRAEYVVISATSPLDQFYLARTLHRSLPDARLIFDAPNTLFVRDIDDEPFIGALAFGSYHLIGLSNPSAPGFGGRAFSSDQAIAYYNAVSKTFWDHKTGHLSLMGYRNPMVHGDTVSPSLQVSVIGNDGYYLLGTVAPQAQKGTVWFPAQQKLSDIRAEYLGRLPLYPSLSWSFLCVFVSLICIVHIVAMTWASFWSPATRDLALCENDQPYRRSLYIRVGAVMLCSMALVSASPIFALVFRVIAPRPSAIIIGAITASSGIAVLWFTWSKTHPHLKQGPPIDPDKQERSRADARYYKWFKFLTWAVLVIILLAWGLLCIDGLAFPKSSFAGTCFAYRCLHPQSGVSPLIPVVLLLAGWFLWSIFQTLRLRFSECNRPMLPRGYSPGAADPYPLYTSDDMMEADNKSWTGCLYRNITALLITREVVLRFVRNRQQEEKKAEERGKATGKEKTMNPGTADKLLNAGYLFTFFLFLSTPMLYSVDRLFLRQWWLSPFDYLLRALLFPLLVVCVTGCLRLVFVWSALKRGLLEYMENTPLRFAFTRLKGSGWKSMFRQSGLREQWRDMARSIESARQLVEEKDVQAYARTLLFENGGKEKPNSYGQSIGIVTDSEEIVPLRKNYEELEHNIRALMAFVNDKTVDTTAPGLRAISGNRCVADPAVANSDDRTGLRLMHAIEDDFAKFAQILLDYLLIPNWNKRTRGFVQSEEAMLAQDDGKPHGKDSETHHFISLAEEFVAIRYLSLIRAVLVNLRYLMTFVTAAFVLTIIAWNSYTFEPRDLVNGLFTILLVFLVVCIVVVFAQMHRDPVLSRITDKRPNELGWDFYLRVASFGIVPVLTWLAYNHPKIGVTLYQLFQSSNGAQ